MPLPAQPFRVRAATCLVAGLMLGCSAPAPSSQGPGAPAAPASVLSLPSASLSVAAHDFSGHILFARTVGDDQHPVFVANADGTSERRLVLPPSSGPARVSPDGMQVLVFTADGPDSATGAGATIGIDGSGYTVLPITDPTLNYIPQIWSPDAKRIAFEGWDASDPTRNGIYTARAADGGDIVRVTSIEGGPHDSPADYSPDGTQIVFYRAVAEDPGPWDLGGALWVVNVGGSGARQIETPGVMPSPNARWSPDGTRILFSTARAQSEGDLWTVNPDGSNLTRIFHDADGRFAVGPVWSRDGSQIMFTINPIADWYSHPANDIYVTDADGTDLARVTGGSTFKAMVDWWP